PPLAPALDHVLHFVLCDFGPRGTAYVETDPGAADELTAIRSIVTGEHARPLRVIACHPVEGWCRDVSAQIAETLADVAELPDVARISVEMHAQPDAMRPLDDALREVEAARKAVEPPEAHPARLSAKVPSLADLTRTLPDEPGPQRHVRHSR